MKNRYSYPHSIENGGGEKITFLRIVQGPRGETLELENEVQPGKGPPMHIHFRQAESLTVVSGKMGYQLQGGAKQFAGPGESVVFEAGKAHRFWAEGNEVLRCTGWVSPPNNVEYFLTELYQTTKENGGQRPGNFEGAYLLKLFGSEFDIVDIPGFVKKVMFPLTVFFGKLTGKHKRYQDAPPAVK